MHLVHWDKKFVTVLLENGLEVAPIRGVDLTDADAAQEAISDIANDNGPIQGLVNVAGGFAWETVMDGDISTWKPHVGNERADCT